MSTEKIGLKQNGEKHTVHWFRKGLRLHDNPAFKKGLVNATTFRCVFVIDPWFAGSSNVGINKWRFLLQCLEDLDRSLRNLNSRLFVIRGQPADTLPKLFKKWQTNCLSFEHDPEPFGKVRDHNITEMCKELNIEVIQEISHTLYKLEDIIEKNGGRAPLTYHQFQAVISSMDPPNLPEPSIAHNFVYSAFTPIQDDHDENYGVPTLEELGFDTDSLTSPVWFGGETEALARLERHLERKAWVASFGRPKMTPQSLLPSQTGLSPYLRFGCLSTRLFYFQLTDLYKKIKKTCPPLSLHGQILWREFFYCAATKNSNFDKMSGNSICVQIPWDKNQEALAKWANGQTGFPWIDAVMSQLREEGWIHHLARHAVACFLTRGDLWISWEEGMKVFEELLLDADWSVNAGMWMWLSCSSFFQQFFHCYCPVRFGRKADPNGDYIRKYLPVLKNYPTKYIHEPWNAPESVQKAAKCIIGTNYSLPMVNHAVASRINMERMKQVYQQLSKYRGKIFEDEQLKSSTLLCPKSQLLYNGSPSPTTIISNVNNSGNYICQTINTPNNTINQNYNHYQHYQDNQPQYLQDNHSQFITNDKHMSYNNIQNQQNLNNSIDISNNIAIDQYEDIPKNHHNFSENQENQNSQYNRIILHRNIALNTNPNTTENVLNNHQNQDEMLKYSKNIYDVVQQNFNTEFKIEDETQYENYLNYKTDEKSFQYNNDYQQTTDYQQIMNDRNIQSNSNMQQMDLQNNENMNTNECPANESPG